MSTPRILLLTHRVPYPLDRGDRIRAFRILQCLSRRAEVALACLADQPPTADTVARLTDLTGRLAIEHRGTRRWLGAVRAVAAGRSVTEGYFASRRLRRTVSAWHRDRPFDLVVPYCSSMLQYVDAAMRRDCRTVFDCVDVDSRKWSRLADGLPAWHPKRWIYRREAGRIAALERQAIDWADRILLVTEAEASLFHSLHSPGGAAGPAGRKVVAVPNGVDVGHYAPHRTDADAASDEAEHGGPMVFVGGLDYPPNVAGVRWFAREVLPLVQRRHPDARFRLVGRDPSPAVLALGGLRGVEVVGGVPDVRPYLRSARLVVAPLFVAQGIQNKILQAMSVGRPVVATPEAATGLTLDPNRPELTVATGPEQWADACSTLLADNRLAESVGRAARAYVCRHHDWDRCLAPLAEMVGHGPRG